MNSLCGLSPSLGSGIWVSGSFQCLDQADKWEAASRALTCSRVCLQPEPDAPTSINSSVALDVKGESQAGSGVRGPAVYTLTPREAGAVCGTNPTSHVLHAFIQVRLLAQLSNKGFYSALSSLPSRHGLLAGAVEPSVRSPPLTLGSSHSSPVDADGIDRESLRRHSPQTQG